MTRVLDEFGKDKKRVDENKTGMLSEKSGRENRGDRND